MFGIQLETFLDYFIELSVLLQAIMRQISCHEFQGRGIDKRPVSRFTNIPWNYMCIKFQPSYLVHCKHSDVFINKQGTSFDEMDCRAQNFRLK